VRQLLHAKIRAAYSHPQFTSDVIKPLMVEEIIDQQVKNLSGGELQRLAITLALGKPAGTAVPCCLVALPCSLACRFFSATPSLPSLVDSEQTFT
jgi:hypothetical protein